MAPASHAAGPSPRVTLLVVLITLAAGCARRSPPPPAPAPTAAPPRLLEFEATAYSTTGTTASARGSACGMRAPTPEEAENFGRRVRVEILGEN
ncbi:MAG TPA: hypothetical protein VNO26_16240 [Candidatus Limnocylindria bacterium]|nr:hypothetical protein [Candidatus Limnocylindria bacterium]